MLQKVNFIDFVERMVMKVKSMVTVILMGRITVCGLGHEARGMRRVSCHIMDLVSVSPRRRRSNRGRGLDSARSQVTSLSVIVAMVGLLRLLLVKSRVQRNLGFLPLRRNQGSRVQLGTRLDLLTRMPIIVLVKMLRQVLALLHVSVARRERNIDLKIKL
jgi:hypothetical protein